MNNAPNPCDFWKRALASIGTAEREATLNPNEIPHHHLTMPPSMPSPRFSLSEKLITDNGYEMPIIATPNELMEDPDA